MQIHFKGTNYDVSPEVQAFALKKLNALTKFAGKEEHAEAQAYLELGKESEAHQNGRIWRAEINFDKEGERFRAVATEESLEDAIDKIIAELSRELRSAKHKKESLSKRGGAVIKSMLRGFRS